MAASTSAAPTMIASARAVHLSKRLDMVTTLRIIETCGVTTGHQRDYRCKVNWRQPGETESDFHVILLNEHTQPDQFAPVAIQRLVEGPIRE